MDALLGLRALCAVLGFASAALCLPAVWDAARRARSAQRAGAAMVVGGSGPAARILRNGLGPATCAARVLARVPRVERYFVEMCWLARLRGYRTDEERMGGVLLVVILAAFSMGWAMSASPVFGAMLCACIVAGLGIAAHQARERQVEEMRESVPDMLHTMSACFHAGYTLVQSFGHLARESQGPLRRLFLRAESDLRTGRTVTEALSRMRGESALSELAFVTAALEIQHQTGGSMQKILDSACESIEGELALRRSLRVQTAQARLSMRIVTIMPFVLVGIFSLASPGFLSPFFDSALGLAVLGTALGMQAAGIVAVRRLLDVKED